MNPTPPTHAPMTQFPVADGCLVVGGVPIAELAQRVGRTPFYVYDRAPIAARVATLRAALPDAIRLHYAIKANPFPALVRYMTTLVDGLDVASAGELQVALAAGMAPGAISFAGPGKTPAELARALAAGIDIHLESPAELERVIALAERAGTPARVAVRVNPDFELKSSGMKMGGGPKAFGVDAERVPELLRRIGAAGLHFRGFHIFSGSQNLHAAALVEAQGQTFDLALRLAEHAPSPVEVLGGAAPGPTPSSATSRRSRSPSRRATISIRPRQSLARPIAPRGWRIVVRRGSQ